MEDDFFQVAEQMMAAATGRLQWPSDAILYHLPAERELLADTARTLMLKTYLEVSGLEYASAVAINADYMSPSGKAPFLYLKVGPQPIMFSDFDRLVAFLESQGLGVGGELGLGERAEQEAFVSLIRTKIAPAEEYQTWVNKKNVREYSLRTHGYGLPWPLHTVVPRLQQARFCWQHWQQLYHRAPEELLLDFEQACRALAERLGAQQTFFPSCVTVLDVVAYSHLQAVMTTVLPSNELARIATQFPNLQTFCNGSLTTAKTAAASAAPLQ